MLGGGAGPYGGEDEADEPISDINVTPLVDITLVLLIIFMVTASYIVNPAIRVDLPKAATGEEVVQTTLALGLDREGTLFLNGNRSSYDEVRAVIARALPEKPDLQAVIAADRAVAHGEVIRLIDTVRQAGVRRFAINVERDQAR